jgi:SpoIID/LytB domain protein
VPRLWPTAALEAQVVAARSYALAHLGHPGTLGEELGYQLCATDACQVYLGLGISNGPYGDRWRNAVDATAGQVLLYQGRVAETLYSSTSNGHTIGNDQVFGSAPLPYLRPVVERDDGASPLSRWRATITFDDVGRFLRAAGDWSRRRISSVALSGGTVIVRGGGATKRLSVAEFRSDLNSWAHCLAPDRYPTFDTDGRLPQTVPSIWFTLSTSGQSVVLHGRGWGHGVGMVQWGAYGKAKRGLSYERILAYYYGGLRPQRFEEPDEIRVGIAVGLDSLVVEPAGTVTVEGAQQVPPGPWLLTAGKNGPTLATGLPVPPDISPGAIVRSPSRTAEGRRIRATLSLPQTSVVHLVLETDSGDVPISSERTYTAGSVRLRGRLPQLASGTYRLVAVVTDGIDIVRTPGRQIAVLGSTASPSPSPSLSPASPSVAPSPSASAPASPAGWETAVGIGVIAFLVLLGLILASRAVGRWRRATR